MSTTATAKPPIAHVDRRARQTRPGSIGRAADGLLMVFALGFGWLSLGMVLDRPDPLPGPVVVVDVGVGLACCLALWWRRRWPVAIALVLAVAGVVSDMASGAILIMLLTVAVHRRWDIAVSVALAHAAGPVVYYWLRPDPALDVLTFLVLIWLLFALVVAVGMFVRARRQLIESLRNQLDRAQDEQAWRVERAQHAERTRIAREIHDVLAHRLSLLSMHAAALEFRSDASPDEVRQVTAVMRDCAHQALEDLRDVVGVLRTTPDAAIDRPQPTLADLSGLVQESTQAGMRMRMEMDVPDLADLPPFIGRNAYRIVQEGLTNARKHAPGAPVDVRVSGRPGHGLVLDMNNAPPSGARPSAEASGSGLVGLTERAELCGGRLEHRLAADGSFRLTVHLPWPA